MLTKITPALIVSISLICAALGNGLSIDDLKVLDRPYDQMMTAYLTELVDHLFELREERLARLETAEDWRMRAEEIRSAMSRWADLPHQRSPLNARITGRIEREDYVVEKVLFESRPSFFVSANLYLPRKEGPRPAILNVLGHNSDGKTSKEKQRRCIAQVKRGFVAFIIDGIGQGERGIQDYTPFGRLPGSVHQTVGAQAFLAGTHLFSYMVWDAIRAVDYLCSRPEVDPGKIGITGTSGGGMMSTYILPLEPRIAVAVPACNPNTWSHRVHAHLSTDHEQVFFGAFREGIDPRGDPLFAHAPRPLLINATSDDNLNPPRGVWALHSWLYHAYASQGGPEKLQTTMVDAGHDYNREQREITYAWMMRWLTNEVASYPEGDLKVEDEKDLWATSTGNIYDLENSLKPQDLVRDYYLEHKAKLQPPQTREELTQRKSRLAAILQDLMSLKRPVEAPASGERAQRVVDGWVVRPILLRPEERIILPATWLSSGSSSDERVVLYVSENGTKSLVEDPEIVTSLLEAGARILAVDLRGMGETAPGMEDYFWDFLAGEPISGQRVEDVLSVFSWLTSRGIQLENIRVWAQGLPGLWAAVACLLVDPLGGMVLENVLNSFEDVILTPLPRYNHELLLPGITNQLDIPDIYGALCPTPLVLINPLRADKTQLTRTDADRTFGRTRRTYRNLNIEQVFSVDTAVEGSRRERLIADALLD